MNNKLSDEYKEVLGPADLYERDKVSSMFRPLALFFLENIPLVKGAQIWVCLFCNRELVPARG